MTRDLKGMAGRLRDLHHGEGPLVLPNAWDAASAKIVEEAGFPAVATASAAVAAMLGYPDHEGAPAEEMFAAAGRVAKAVSVPVTVDAEAGYGLPAKEFVERLLAIGAVGCNLEDTDHRAGGLVDPDRQAGRIAAVRAAARDAGVEIVINARVDVFLEGTKVPGGRVGEALRRGRRYLEAGADCVYPIMASAEEDIAALVAELPGPVNLGCFPGTPGLPRLIELGAARISFGPRPYRTALEALKGMVGQIAAGRDPYEG